MLQDIKHAKGGELGSLEEKELGEVKKELFTLFQSICPYILFCGTGLQTS
jgi:hypothetical protein